MTVREVTAEEYSAMAFTHPHVYNSVEFARLNAHKTDGLRYLTFTRNGEPKAGIILGERAGRLLSPFSAPFGGFSTAGQLRLETVEQAVEALCGYAKHAGMDIGIVLPPQLYAPTLTAHCINALSRMATLRHIDLNYYFPLDKCHGYEQIIDRSARKNLRRARSASLELEAVARDDRKGMATAYDIIRRNREEHGYELKMSLDDVADTTEIIDADFFLLRHAASGDIVAAAQVFHVAKGIAQVIYWGDLRAYGGMRPMNGLAHLLFEHYHNAGLSTLDIGPSTTDGIPNLGLCDFKTAIGCEIVPKFAFEIAASH